MPDPIVNVFDDDGISIFLMIQPKIQTGRKTIEGEVPDSCSICGVPIDPAQRMTSASAFTSVV